MKKLLLTSAVLVGMGASQAFAANTDSWTGIVSASVENYCSIDATPALRVNGGATVGTIADAGTGTLSLTDMDLLDGATGLQNTGLDVEVLFAGNSVVCNWAHDFTVMSSLGGFASENAERAADLSADSDAFQTKISHVLEVANWDSKVNTTTGWAAVPEASIGNWSDLDNGDYALNANDDDDGGATGASVTRYEVTAVPAFHNDGDNTSVSPTTGDGLLLTLALQAGTGEPLLAGNYRDAFMLKIGGGL